MTGRERGLLDLILIDILIAEWRGTRRRARESHNTSFSSFSPRCPTPRCGALHSPGWPSKPIKCPGCQKKICLEDRLACLRECEALYARGLASMEDERVDEAIETLCDALKRFHRVACPPHRDTHLAEIALSSCLADCGNTWRPTALWSSGKPPLNSGRIPWPRDRGGLRRSPSDKRRGPFDRSVHVGRGHSSRPSWYFKTRIGLQYCTLRVSSESSSKVVAVWWFRSRLFYLICFYLMRLLIALFV